MSDVNCPHCVDELGCPTHEPQRFYFLTYRAGATRGRRILAVPRDCVEVGFEDPCPSSPQCVSDAGFCGCRVYPKALSLASPFGFTDLDRIFDKQDRPLAKQGDWHETLDAANERVREHARNRIRYLKGEMRRLERIAAGELAVGVARGIEHLGCMVCGEPTCEGCQP